MTWTNLENIMLSEKSQTQRAMLCESIHGKYPDQANPQRQEADQWLPGAGGREEWGVTANRYGVSLGADESVPKLYSGDGCTILRIS